MFIPLSLRLLCGHLAWCFGILPTRRIAWNCETGPQIENFAHPWTKECQQTFQELVGVVTVVVDAVDVMRTLDVWPAVLGDVDRRISPTISHPAQDVTQTPRVNPQPGIADTDPSQRYKRFSSFRYKGSSGVSMELMFI